MQSLETLRYRVSGWAERDPSGRAQGEGDMLGKLGIFLLLPRGSEEFQERRPWSHLLNQTLLISGQWAHCHNGRILYPGPWGFTPQPAPCMIQQSQNHPDHQTNVRLWWGLVRILEKWPDLSSSGIYHNQIDSAFSLCTSHRDLALTLCADTTQ